MDQLFNLQHLKFFFDTVSCGSVSEAAKRNFVTQSAVSQGISKLEKSFGSPLINHQSHKLHVTPEGQVLYEHAGQIFGSIRETFNKVSQASNEIAGILRFTTSKSVGLSLVQTAYQKLKAAHPKVEISFKMGGPNIIRSALRRESAEFAITVDGEMFDQFEKHPVAEGEMFLYQRKKSPKKLVEQGIYVDKLSGLHVDSLNSSLNGDYPIKTFDAGWEFTAQIVDAGFGVGFLPEFVATSGRYSNLEKHPLVKGGFPYRICALTNKGRKLSRAAEAFLECIQ